MQVDFDVIEEVGDGIFSKYRIPDTRHPLIKALLRLGVRKGTIAKALGVPRITIWNLKQYSGFLDDNTEWDLLSLLLVAYRCASDELEHLKASPDLRNLHPSRKLMHEHEIKDLEANLAFADEIIRDMMGLVQRNYR